MNLLDFQILSSPSVNHRYSENKPNFGYFDHMAGYNASNDSTNTSSKIIMPSNPATNTQKSQEKKLQRGIYKGPDVFGTVLGPTADESILVGIQALMDMASTLEFCVFTPAPCTHDTPVDSPSKESPEVSKPVSQISASCQYHVTDLQENTAFSAQPSMKSRSQSAQSVSPPQSPPRQLSPTESLIASPNRPCTQFFHQMTRISVLKNSLEDAPTCLACSQKRTNCKLLKQPTLIFPDTVNDSVDVSSTAIQEKISVGSETTKETTSKPIQTLPFRKRKLKHANVETNSVISQEKTSIACGCNFCAPIFGKVSQTPSRMSNVCKIISDIRLSGQMEIEKTFSACCSPIEIAVLPVVDEKLCTCSLMPEGVRLADAAISCLKVNTSCQYDTSEIAAFESRSTQCGELNDKRESCSQLCSESGDYPPRGKNSFRILGGPYECPDFSETRYSMDPGDNGSVIPLLDCNDDPSKFCFENPAMVCMEMGDFCGSPPIEVRYAITKITKFRDFSTFEIMKSTSKKPKSMPKTVEGVFVLKKEENYCSSNSKTYE